MDLISAIVIGLVEGLTEFLPVSSTGHILIAEHFLGAHPGDAWNVLIQVGPILASALVFRARIWSWVRGWKDKVVQSELLKVIVAFLITGIGGFVLQKAGIELPDEVTPIAIATLLGVPVIFWIEARASKRTLSPIMTWNAALAVAAAQLLAATFPGTSRSGACIMAAIAIGVARPVAVEFSFLVGIPTMFAAGGYKLLKAVKAHETAIFAEPSTWVAFVVATVSAFLAVRWLLHYVQTRDFRPFAWYRLALGIALLAMAMAV
jgi:undecaprenyl-diphosphatase